MQKQKVLCVVAARLVRAIAECLGGRAGSF
jgi:hypothetical protein